MDASRHPESLPGVIPAKSLPPIRSGGGAQVNPVGARHARAHDIHPRQEARRVGTLPTAVIVFCHRAHSRVGWGCAHPVFLPMPHHVIPA